MPLSDRPHHTNSLTRLWPCRSTFGPIILSSGTPAAARRFDRKTRPDHTPPSSSRPPTVGATTLHRLAPNPEALQQPGPEPNACSNEKSTADAPSGWPAAFRAPPTPSPPSTPSPRDQATDHSDESAVSGLIRRRAHQPTPVATSEAQLPPSKPRKCSWTTPCPWVDPKSVPHPRQALARTASIREGTE